MKTRIYLCKTKHIMGFVIAPRLLPALSFFEATYHLPDAGEVSCQEICEFPVQAEAPRMATDKDLKQVELTLTLDGAFFRNFKLSEVPRGS